MARLDFPECCFWAPAQLEGQVEARQMTQLNLVLPRVTLELNLVLPRATLELNLVLPRATLELNLVLPRATLELQLGLPRVTLELQQLVAMQNQCKDAQDDRI